LIVFWQTAILLIAAAFWALALTYRRSGDAREHPQPWIRRSAFGAAALGAAWGFATAVFFPGGEYQQVFIAFVVALVTAGGLTMFATVWWIYAVYAAGVMIPFNGVLFAYGTDFFHLLGAAVPLLYVANVATAYQLGKAFTSAYGLRSAYQRLSADNADTQVQLAEQRDGLELACEWTMTPLVDDDNQIVSVILQGRDITQQRAAERMRSEFTSTLSHELRTPLTSIIGSLQLLRAGALGEVPKEQDEM